MGKPKIRFKGFTEDWEQRKLGALVDRVTRKNQDLVSELPLTISAQYGLIDQNEFFDKRVASKDVSGYYLIENGEFAYNKSTSTDAPWGAIKRLERYENGVLSTLYIVFRIKDDASIDSDFLVSYYSTNLWHKGIHEIAAEGARNHGLLNIAPTDFFDTKLAIPQDVEEQCRIGQCFTKLEALITLHQRKCDETKKLKKYMLQKMFPKNGMKVPEIRFEGFSDAWEQRKVGDLLQERNEQAAMSEDYPLMAFIANQGVAPKGERYDRSALVNDEVGKKYKRTEFGDFIYSSNNLESGSIGLNKYGNACISPVYSIFKPIGNADLNFLGRRFLRKDFINEMIKWRQGVVYGQWKIHESDFSKIQIEVPNTDEQKKMGEYFDRLDRLITLHQRKLKILKNIKKSMLEKIFV